MPLAGELTASVIDRVAARYGLVTNDVLRLWTCHRFPRSRAVGGLRP